MLRFNQVFRFLTRTACLRSLLALTLTLLVSAPTLAQQSRISLVNFPTYQMTFVPQQTIQTVMVQVQDDGQPHNASVIILNLGLVSVNGGSVLGAALNGTANTLQFTLNPVNSPKGVYEFAAASATTAVVLGQQGSLTVTRNFGTTGPFALTYVFSPSPIQVIDINSGQLAFADGQASAAITFELIDTGFPSLFQSFNVYLDSITALDPTNNPVNVTGPFIVPQFSLAVINVPPAHDPYGRFAFASPNSFSVTKNVGTFAVTVLRSQGKLGAVTLQFSLLGTAVLGVDYTISPSGGSLNFAANQAQASFLVCVYPACRFDSNIHAGDHSQQLHAQPRRHNCHRAHRHCAGRRAQRRQPHCH